MDLINLKRKIFTDIFINKLSLINYENENLVKLRETTSFFKKENI